MGVWLWRSNKISGIIERKDNKKVRINAEITVREVLLIDQHQTKIGVTALRDALRMALEASLDLVEIAPNSNPPVCRIMDFGKYQYQLKKKQKKPKQTQVKEIKFRPVTEEGDYQVKLRNLVRFLEHGDKVKITIRFRGRELAHQELGAKLIEKIRIDAEEFGIVEQIPKLEGKQLVMIIGPKKKK